MGAVRRSAEARGLGISVDPASSAELSRFGVERFLALVSGVDLLLPNLAEARLLTGAATARRRDRGRCHCSRSPTPWW